MVARGMLGEAVVAAGGTGAAVNLQFNAFPKIAVAFVIEPSPLLSEIPHMEPYQPIECDSKPLDVQFAFE